MFVECQLLSKIFTLVIYIEKYCCASVLIVHLLVPKINYPGVFDTGSGEVTVLCYVV